MLRERQMMTEPYQGPSKKKKKKKRGGGWF